MDDTISRQAAINAIRNIRAIRGTSDDSILLIDKAEAQTELMMLPSTQPLVLTCDGCRHIGTYDTDFPCSGCIRREKDYYEQER